MNEEKAEQLSFEINDAIEIWTDGLPGQPDTMMGTGEPCFTGFMGYDCDLEEIRERVRTILNDAVEKEGEQ